MIPDLGKHYYVISHFMVPVKGSLKVPSRHCFSHYLHLGHRNLRVASGRRWSTHLTCFDLCSVMSGRPAAIPTSRQLHQERLILAFVIWKALFCRNGSRRLARGLPCDPKLENGARLFSHDVHMLADLGQHYYVMSHFMVPMERSLKVPSRHCFSHYLHLGGRKSKVTSERRWPTHFTCFDLCSPMSGRPAAIQTRRQLDQGRLILALRNSALYGFCAVLLHCDPSVLRCNYKIIFNLKMYVLIC